jgi:hypothetical protein
MGKRPEDLNLNDQPHPPPAKPGPAIDPRDTDWYRFSQEIDDLLYSGSYTWAEDTLTDIKATVERTQSVSPAQRRAVENIENARSNRGSRRGEGHRRW